MESRDLNGGSVDAIFETLEARFPDITIERLKVTHPGGDDDNLWFLRRGSNATYEMQIETRAGGEPPFLLEGDAEGQRVETSSAATAIRVAAEWLEG